jgi:hypothetical protein
MRTAREVNGFRSIGNSNMKMSASLLLALYLASPWLSAVTFKCTDANGNDKYQNFPRPIDSIGSKATAAPGKEETSKCA